MFSLGNLAPYYDFYFGGVDDVRLLGYEVDEIFRTVKLKFTRLLNTGDPRDVILKKEKQTIMYAINEETDELL